MWFVDPIARTLEVYRHGGEVWIRSAAFHDDARVCAEPFDAIEFSLTVLWER